MMYLVMVLGFMVGIGIGWLLLFALFGMMVYFQSKVKP